MTGKIYVGFGERLDEDKAVAIPAGAVYVAPAKTPHHIWAKEGERGMPPIKRPASDLQEPLSSISKLTIRPENLIDSQKWEV